jgi:hypothetical protein
VNDVGQQGQQRGAFLDAIEAQLRPLMPVVLGYGVSAQDIGEVFKTLYIESLAERLRDLGRPATVARLALMAGLTRHEVESLLRKRRERRQLRARSGQKLDGLSKLLTTWHDDNRFSTPYGVPLDLSLHPDGNFKTFAELVAVAGGDVDQSLVLDELLAAGCVEVHADKFVRCVTRVFIPVGTDSSKIARLGRYVAALNRNMVHNLLRKPEEESEYERVITTNSPLKRDFHDIARDYLLKNCEPFVGQLDRWFESQEEEFRDPKGSRFGLCMFFFDERPAEENGGAEPELLAG